jgi:hypothetical protein
MKKQIINIRLYQDEVGVKGALFSIQAVEWSNSYGARIFIDKRAKDSLWYSTEFSSGMNLTHAKTRTEMLMRIQVVLDQPDKLIEFHRQVEVNIQKYGYANKNELCGVQ